MLLGWLTACGSSLIIGHLTVRSYYAVIELFTSILYPDIQAEAEIKFDYHLLINNIKTLFQN